MTATRRCRWCGHPIELWTALGRWMHVTLGEDNPSTSDGTAWWHCEITSAQPPAEVTGFTAKPRWQVGEIRTLADARGRQIVQVLGRYEYTWDGEEPLKVGDWVILPPNVMHDEEWLTRVTGIGSTWTGEFSSVLGKLPKEE